LPSGLQLGARGDFGHNANGETLLPALNANKKRALALANAGDFRVATQNHHLSKAHLYGFGSNHSKLQIQYRDGVIRINKGDGEPSCQLAADGSFARAWQTNQN
jgi:hypothetical protein